MATNKKSNGSVENKNTTDSKKQTRKRLLR